MITIFKTQIDGLRLVSEANSRDSWPVKMRRVRSQRGIVRLRVGATDLRKAFLEHGSVAVTLTRIAPRFFDDDNLRGAFKAVRDQIACEFGVPDNNPRIFWMYAQERGKPKEHGIRIEIGNSAAAW